MKKLIMLFSCLLVLPVLGMAQGMKEVQFEQLPQTVKSLTHLGGYSLRYGFPRNGYWEYGFCREEDKTGQATVIRVYRGNQEKSVINKLLGILLDRGVQFEYLNQQLASADADNFFVEARIIRCPTSYYNDVRKIATSIYSWANYKGLFAIMVAKTSTKPYYINEDESRISNMTFGHSSNPIEMSVDGGNPFSVGMFKAFDALMNQQSGPFIVKGAPKVCLFGRDVQQLPGKKETW